MPNAPRTLVAIDPRCQSQIRQPDSLADRAVTRAGWSLFGAAQVFGPVTVVNGMAAADGMCRPSLYNTFVFVSNRFAGTLAPTTMESRSDGSLSMAMLTSPENVTAEFARYRSTDALCCPSQRSVVSYTISGGTRPLVRPSDVRTAQNCDREDGEVTTQDNVVFGTITYRQRAALPPNAVVTVRLVELSQSGIPAATIVEQRVDNSNRQVPLSFEFAYDRARISERNRYAVLAEIRDNGRLIYTTDSSYPVITQGNPKKVDITVVPVGGGGQGNQRNTVRGTVTYRERIALPANSEVRVWMVDSQSPNTAPVAETTFSTANRQVPYQFEMRFENRDIDRQLNYEVRAEIRSNGQVSFRSTKGTPIDIRGFQNNDAVEIVVSPASDEPTAVTGKSFTLSKFGTGSMRVGNRNSQFLIRGSVVVKTDGTATVTVGTITNQTVFSGTLVFADDSTLRIAVASSLDADASGEIEISYSDRRLNSITGNNLTLDGQAVVLRF